MEIISEKILRCLMDVEGYITANSLAELTGISESNIKHNLYQVRRELELYGVRLLSVPKKGLRLEARPEQRREILQMLDETVSRTAEFYTYRKEYILDTLFLFQANYTTQMFAEELSVSRNTIQRDLDQIDRDLRKFHVRIRRVRNQGIVLEGDEFNIRQAMTECNNSKYWNWSKDIIVEDTGCMDPRISKKAYTYLTSTYLIKDLEAIQKQLQVGEQELGIQFVDVSYGRLMEYLAITMERVRLGKVIHNKPSDENMSSITDRYLQVADTMIKVLLPNKKREYTAEIQYLAARLFVAPVCNDYLITTGSDFLKDVSAFLVKFEVILQTGVLSQDEKLKKELQIAFMRIKVRESFQILDWSELYRDIHRQLTALYGICLLQMDEVEAKIGFQLRQDDIAWIVLLIHNCLVDIHSRIPAILVHGTNHHIALFQKRKIEEVIPQLHIMKHCYYRDYLEKGRDKTLVIATVPLQRQAVNVIEITKHISPTDLDKIQKWIDQSEWDYPVSLRQEILKEFISRNLVLSSLCASTKEDALRQMSGLLLEEGSIEEGFQQEILEHEKICPSAIGNEIAIPHQYQNYVLRNRIVIARVKNKIRWNQEQRVRLVFLVAVSKEDPVRVRVFFHCLYRLLENSTLLQKLMTEKTELYDILMTHK